MIEIEIGCWGGSQRKPKQVRNHAEILRLYAELNNQPYISTPVRPEPFQIRNAEKGKKFVWSYGRHGCWSDNVCTDIPTWERCKEIARRYNSIVKTIKLDQRRAASGLTKCPKCKEEKAVEYREEAWANVWDCLYCDYDCRFSLGD